MSYEDIEYLDGFSTVISIDGGGIEYRGGGRF